MLYVRKGLFSETNVASADALSSEFNRAVDSVSMIDHMMIVESALDRDNFCKPYESTRAPSSTHKVVYTVGGGVASSDLFRVSRDAGGQDLVRFSEGGSGAAMEVKDGSLFPSTAPALALDLYLADYAKVLVVANCQYEGPLSPPAPDPQFADLEMRVVVNGSPGRRGYKGIEAGGFGRVMCALSILDSFELPGGNHRITLSVSERLDDASKTASPSSEGIITKATIGAVGLYR